MRKDTKLHIEAFHAGYQAGYENGKRDAVKEICQDCGNVFEAGRYTFLCPECRRRRQKETARRINLGEIGRKSRSAKIKSAKTDGKESGDAEIH